MDTELGDGLTHLFENADDGSPFGRLGLLGDRIVAVFSLIDLTRWYAISPHASDLTSAVQVGHRRHDCEQVRGTAEKGL
jgi:hypothetical protein